MIISNTPNNFSVVNILNHVTKETVSNALLKLGLFTNTKFGQERLGFVIHRDSGLRFYYMSDANRSHMIYNNYEYGELWSEGIFYIKEQKNMIKESNYNVDVIVNILASQISDIIRDSFLKNEMFIIGDQKRDYFKEISNFLPIELWEDKHMECLQVKYNSMSKNKLSEIKYAIKYFNDIDEDYLHKLLVDEVTSMDENKLIDVDNNLIPYLNLNKEEFWGSLIDEVKTKECIEAYILMLKKMLKCDILSDLVQSKMIESLNSDNSLLTNLLFNDNDSKA